MGRASQQPPGIPKSPRSWGGRPPPPQGFGDQWGGDGCSWEVNAAAGTPCSVLLNLYRDGVHLPPHFDHLLPACISRGSWWGVAGGLLDGVPHMGPLPGLLLNGSPLLPTHSCLQGRGGDREQSVGKPSPFNPITTPCPPRAAHQQVDTTGNAQTDSAQDGGKQEASRDGQPESTREGEGGGSGCAPHPQPHSRCMQDGTDVVTPGERSKHLQHCRHVPLATVG